jgi:hypothetical protein
MSLVRLLILTLLSKPNHGMDAEELAKRVAAMMARAARA